MELLYAEAVILIFIFTVLRVSLWEKLVMLGPKIQLILQRMTLVDDGMGGKIEKWSSLRKIKGVLVPLKGNERFITGKTEMFASHKFFIDYPKGLTITQKDRFALGARTFEIRFIADPAERHVHLEIDLEEIT